MKGAVIELSHFKFRFVLVVGKVEIFNQAKMIVQAIAADVDQNYSG
jgi:hypothetical protein